MVLFPRPASLPLPLRPCLWAARLYHSPVFSLGVPRAQPFPRTVLALTSSECCSVQFMSVQHWGKAEGGGRGHSSMFLGAGPFPGLPHNSRDGLPV